MYDFDEVIDRKNTGSVKHDFAGFYGVPEKALPLWVADMDFCSPAEVSQALIRRMEHCVYGYTDVKPDGEYFAALAAWMKNRHGWEVKPEWLVKTPGVVFAIAMAVQALTKKGESVLIQPPVYHPFETTVLMNGRKLVKNNLVIKNNRYEIDFEDFEKKIKENDVKLFIFCSPHNPVGRVWHKDELEKLARICLENNVFVVSDEIHSDFIFPGNNHIPLSLVNEEIAWNCMICTAPSKTFNIAGLQCSNIFIQNADVRKKIEDNIKACGVAEINIAGLVSCQTAYAHGSQWLDEVLVYIKANIDFIGRFLEEKLPQVKMIYPEGTYLVWLDFRDLQLSQKELNERLLNDCGLWLNDGCAFGECGSGFMRLNAASPASVIQKAMHLMEKNLLKK